MSNRTDAIITFLFLVYLVVVTCWLAAGLVLLITGQIEA